MARFIPEAWIPFAHLQHEVQKDRPHGQDLGRDRPHGASVPISTDDPKSTSRTPSVKVNPARSARDSHTRSSASDTFVPTDFDRSSRFIAHRRRWIVNQSYSTVTEVTLQLPAGGDVSHPSRRRRRRARDSQRMTAVYRSKHTKAASKSSLRRLNETISCGR